MKRVLTLSLALVTTVLVYACSEETVVTPENATNSQSEQQTPDVQALADEMVRLSGWEVVSDGSPNTPEAGPRSQAHGQVFHFERVRLAGDVFHYSYRLRVGPGPFDVIGLHRVVRERRPYKPIRTEKSVFLQHGDLIGFTKFIFGSVTPYLPDEQSMATYLAANDVDVWGIDQPWVLVPDLPDYSFARDWGLQFQVDNLRVGLALARTARLLSGSGFDKLLLLGYSSGGFTGYAYLNDEVQRPEWQRHVRGFIPFDTMFKPDRSVPEFETGRVFTCEYTAFWEDLWAGGGYNTEWGGFFVDAGHLAETSPEGESPYYPGLTNFQAALALGGRPDPTAWCPWYHYVALINEGDPPTPTDLRFTTPEAWFDFMQMGAPFEPTRFVADYNAVVCDEVDLPFDDHLGDVTVPVFNVGAAGGLGEVGVYTLDLLGSADKSSHIISLYPPESEDFGHIDIVTATNTLTDVFPLLLDWIEGHSH